MKCVILQPSYIPWKGYFHQIYKSDIFIFYDDIQYDKEGWRNRNRIKTAQGLQWLTIPVYTKGVVTEGTPINKIEISWNKPWNEHHWKGIQFAYRKAPFFDLYESFFEEIYSEKPRFLADFTIRTTIKIAHEIGIKNVRFLRSSNIKGVTGEKTDRLIELIKHVGADHYISGPSARNYIEHDKFKKAGIELEYMTYSYPEYEQLYPLYEPQVSIIDLMFMTGPKALAYIAGEECEY